MDFLCGLVVRVPGYRSRGPRFDTLRYQIFWEVVGLERGPLSLMNTSEELLGRNNTGSSLEIREYGHRDPLRWPCDTLYPQKVPLTSLTSGGWSIGIVHLQTKVMEFSLYCGITPKCQNLGIRELSQRYSLLAKVKNQSLTAMYMNSSHTCWGRRSHLSTKQSNSCWGWCSLTVVQQCDIQTACKLTEQSPLPDPTACQLMISECITESPSL
jgi:hypothetical protein